MVAILLLVGCAAPATAPIGSVESAPEVEVSDAIEVATETEAENAEQPAKRPDPEDYPVRPFEGDALYNLLLAEVAGYRADYDLALQKYVVTAESTRDPGVAARATRLALYLKQDDAALKTARIWAEADPESIEAHRHAADLLLRSGELEAAILHMEQVKNLGGLAKFEVFAYRAGSMSAEQQASMLQVVAEMLERHPGDEQLLFSKAVLLETTGQHEEALALTTELEQTNDSINIVILKMSVLNALNLKQEALAYMREQVEKKPDNRRLRLLLARLLFEQLDLDAAKAQYEYVLQSSPNDGDILFALALIALEQQDDAQAKTYLERMVRWNRRAGEAHYYLGGIAERASDVTTALREYRQVGTGYEFIPAQARISSLLAADGRWEEARDHLERMRIQQPQMEQQLIMIEAQLLTERGMEEEVLSFLADVVERMPENVDMLYFRAMTGEKFDRLDVLENDLRRIIEVDPDNADALNALGYTLTDQTDRHEEAHELIARALEIKPDEPAFIDSMGWVQYRLKNYDEALKHLRRALDLFKNDEVAAHLGEVLWVVGEKEEARKVWNEGLEFAPDSEILREVIERFDS